MGKTPYTANARGRIIFELRARQRRGAERQALSTEIVVVKQKRSFAILIFFVISSLDAALAFARYGIGASLEAVGLGIGGFVLGLIVYWNRY
jgi:small-conductance mechanosensitive channel